jgi:TIR domain
METSIVSAPIFISYSSKDRDVAETICQALEVRGQNCWIACRDVGAGENFQEAIVRELRSAKVMLLVFTSNANNSDEIKKELVLAGRHQVTVVPVRVEDVVPNDAFAYEFATRQWVDLFEDWEREIELLAARIGQILQSAAPRDGSAETPLPPRRIVKRSSKQPWIWSSALAAALVVIGGGTLYMRSSAPKPASATQAPAPLPTQPQQTAVQTPALAAQTRPSAMPPAPQMAVPTSAPAAVAEPQSSPEEAAWQTATGAGTRVAFAAYLKEFSAGVHAQEAQLRIADQIRTAATASKTFDGSWQTTWTCPNLGQYPGYSYQFAGQVKDGTYHGVKGIKGEPSSLVLDGKIEPDGAASFFGEIIVGSSLVGLGAARGSPSDFHALAQFDRTSATGKRIEGRPCSLSFVKQ